MAAKRIVIDPVTRIEGHLRVEVEVNDGFVTEAFSSGTMVRGLEIILRGRDPRDAWAFAERTCGVCTTVHALASVRSVEDALGIVIPPNAELIRNLMFCAQYMQDHVVHFYHLHALDWVDVVSALKADPARTSELAQSISHWPKSSPGYFSDVQKRIAKFVGGGQLGVFANGYWGHPAMKLPPEANLLGVTHYLEALDWQKEVVKIHAIFGGKNPHPNYLVGGVPCSLNLDEANAINAERLAYVGKLLADAKTFVEQVYIPDLLAIASFYKDWAAIGGGLRNYMAYGDLPTNGFADPGKFKFPRGVILDRDLGKILEVDAHDPQQVKESIAHSWYQYSDGDGAAKHPWDGETKLNYTGPQPPYDQLNVEGKYSWLKTPRWNNHPMEVGPLARLLVGYGTGRADIKDAVDMVLKKLDVPIGALYSTLGRTAAWLAKQVEIGLGSVDLSLPQYRILGLLDESSAVSSDLAQRLAVRPPTITAVVDGLVIRGLVERRTVEGDRRRVDHVLTEEGHRVLDEADAAIDARLHEIADSLGDPAVTEEAFCGLAGWRRALIAYRAARWQR